MHTGLLLGVGLLNQHNLRVGLEVGHLGQLDEVVDADAVVLQVEAGVLEGTGKLDDGLANILNLLLARDLWIIR
jgi:hypothetical protein